MSRPGNRRLSHVRGRHERHQARLVMAQPDPRSPEAKRYRSMYWTPEWRALKRRRLAQEPNCRTCRKMGRQTQATVCDHIRPHKGDPRLFFDFDNTQSLCTVHHSSGKQAAERGRPRVAVGPDGWPSQVQR